MPDLSSNALPSGDLLAFWTGIDVYVNSNHYWVQAGYVLGTAPNGITYAQLEEYVESNGNTYSFQAIASVAWGTDHTFQLWFSCTSCTQTYVTVKIDGSQVAVIQMPSGFSFNGGVIDNIFEGHEAGCCDKAFGVFSNLQYYGCGQYANQWCSWGANGTGDSVSITSPYGVDATSTTQFGIYMITSGTTGGGGGGMKHA